MSRDFHRRYGKHRAELGRMHCLLICDTDEKYAAFLERPGVRDLAANMKSIVRLPNPVFPQVVDDHSGRPVVMDQHLLDVFGGKIKGWIQYKKATCGAVHSHRNCYLWGEIHCPNEWLMIIEDDVEINPNAVQKLLVLLEAAKIDPMVTNMIMLAGSPVPLHSSRQVQSSSVVHRFAKLLDVRTYPAHWQHKYIVPLHVGMGLKWYLVSPEGRRALLQMKVHFKSFERCVWKHIFDTFQIRQPKGHPHPHYMTSVLSAHPVLGECAEAFDEDYNGSGRKRADAGHEERGYILIEPHREWNIAERLNTLCICLVYAKVMNLKIVMLWEKTARVPISFEDLTAIPQAAKDECVYIHAISDRRDSDLNYYRAWGDKRLHVTQPMFFMPSWDLLQRTIRNDPDLMDKDVELIRSPRPYLRIKQRWTQKMHEDLLGSGMPARHEWPAHLYVLSVPDTTDTHTFFNNGKEFDRLAAWFGATKGQSYLQIARTALGEDLTELLERHPSTRIIVLYMDRKNMCSFWQSFVDDFKKDYPDNFVTPTFLTEDKVPTQTWFDERYPNEDFEQWGISLAKCLGILTKAPRDKVLFPIMTWATMLNHTMSEDGELGTADVYEEIYIGEKGKRHAVLKHGPACQPVAVIKHTPCLEKICRDNSKNSWGEWNMLYYMYDLNTMVLNSITTYLDTPLSAIESMVPREAVQAFHHIPEEDVEGAEFEIRKALERGRRNRVELIVDDINDLVESIVTVRLARDKYLDIQTRSNMLWDWQQTFLMLVINTLRQTRSEPPLWVDNEGVIHMADNFDGDWMSLCKGHPPKEPSRRGSPSPSIESSMTRKSSKRPAPPPLPPPPRKKVCLKKPRVKEEDEKP